jgi:hypothetical protein
LIRLALLTPVLAGAFCFTGITNATADSLATQASFANSNADATVVVSGTASANPSDPNTTNSLWDGDSVFVYVQAPTSTCAATDSAEEDQPTLGEMAPASASVTGNYSQTLTIALDPGESSGNYVFCAYLDAIFTNFDTGGEDSVDEATATTTAIYTTASTAPPSPPPTTNPAPTSPSGAGKPLILTASSLHTGAVRVTAAGTGAGQDSLSGSDGLDIFAVSPSAGCDDDAQDEWNDLNQPRVGSTDYPVSKLVRGSYSVAFDFGPPGSPRRYKLCAYLSSDGTASSGAGDFPDAEKSLSISAATKPATPGTLTNFGSAARSIPFTRLYVFAVRCRALPCRIRLNETAAVAGRSVRALDHTRGPAIMMSSNPQAGTTWAVWFDHSDINPRLLTAEVYQHGSVTIHARATLTDSYGASVSASRTIKLVLPKPRGRGKPLTEEEKVLNKVQATFPQYQVQSCRLTDPNHWTCTATVDYNDADEYYIDANVVDGRIYVGNPYPAP